LCSGGRYSRQPTQLTPFAHEKIMQLSAEEIIEIISNAQSGDKSQHPQHLVGNERLDRVRLHNKIRSACAHNRIGWYLGWADVTQRVAAYLQVVDCSPVQVHESSKPLIDDPASSG